MAVQRGSSIFHAAAAFVALAVLVPIPMAIGATSQASAQSAAPNPLCSAAPCAPLITGSLHTDPGSTSVYDSNGTVVPLLGVDVDGLDFGTGTPSTNPDSCGKGWSIPQGSFSDVASWGFNSIRVPISWSEPRVHRPDPRLQRDVDAPLEHGLPNKLDSVVSQFGQAHIPLILDFAQVDLSPRSSRRPRRSRAGNARAGAIRSGSIPA